MESLGLYIHVPFCETKCGYCDFYSIAVSGRPILPLLEATLSELETRLAGRLRPITTIFIGGGTPTVLTEDPLSRLMRPLHQLVSRDRPVEFTVEANPGTLDDAKLAILTASGVDRVSMGAQSFHPRELEALERIHSPHDIPRGVRMCRDHGIRRINLDLIFGIPGQTAASWRESLSRTIDLDVEHVACYGLTYEPGTALTAKRDRGRIIPCDDRLEAEMYLEAIDLLAAAGYEQYEISNFARPGQRCLHNLVYWRNEPYLGVGPSAAGYVNGVRTKNIASIEGYIRRIEQDGHAVVESEQLTGLELAGETAMLGLRLNEGLDYNRFLERTGTDARIIFAGSMATYEKQGWLSVDAGGVALTREGRLMADTVIADFIEEARGRTVGTACKPPVPRPLHTLPAATQKKA